MGPLDPAPTREPRSVVRTCVGCRAWDERRRLLRVVAATEAPRLGAVIDVVPDATASLPGRGAWVHPRDACLDMAERRRAFGRALRLDEPVSTTAVREYLRATRERDNTVEYGSGTHQMDAR